MDGMKAGEDVTKFLEGVNVTQEGFLINNGILGIVYRDKDDFGIGEDQMVLAISSELGKAQKQYVLQEGLQRAYSDMVVFLNGKKDIKVKEREAKEAEIAELKGNKYAIIPEALEAKFLGLKEEMENLTKEWKELKIRSEKDAVLAKIQENQNVLKTTQGEYNEFITKYEQSIKKLEDELVFINSDIGDINGKIKENAGFADNSGQDRDQAKVFIKSSNKMIADIQAGIITQSINS
jgi:hypothetical protein